MLAQRPALAQRAIRPIPRRSTPHSRRSRCFRAASRCSRPPQASSARFAPSPSATLRRQRGRSRPAFRWMARRMLATARRLVQHGWHGRQAPSYASSPLVSLGLRATRGTVYIYAWHWPRPWPVVLHALSCGALGFASRPAGQPASLPASLPVCQSACLPACLPAQPDSQPAPACPACWPAPSARPAPPTSQPAAGTPLAPLCPVQTRCGKSRRTARWCATTPSGR